MAHHTRGHRNAAPLLAALALALLAATAAAQPTLNFYTLVSLILAGEQKPGFYYNGTLIDETLYPCRLIPTFTSSSGAARTVAEAIPAGDKVVIYVLGVDAGTPTLILEAEGYTQRYNLTLYQNATIVSSAPPAAAIIIPAPAPITTTALAELLDAMIEGSYCTPLYTAVYYNGEPGEPLLNFTMEPVQPGVYNATLRITYNLTGLEGKVNLTVVTWWNAASYPVISYSYTEENGYPITANITIVYSSRVYATG